MWILFAILLFSLLIFVHELGHFLAAKASGVQVNEFAIFMGPAIFKKQVGETLYSLRCIPIGGYCAMEGEDEDTENPRSFQKADWWKRLIILLAGAAMNFITGLLIFALLFAMTPGERIITPELEEFTDCCVFAGENGLQPGDRLLEIDGEKIYVYNDVMVVLTLLADETHDVVIQRNGQTVELNDLAMVPHTHTNEDGTQETHYGMTFGSEEANFANRMRSAWLSTVDAIRNTRLSLQLLFSGKVGFSEVSGPVGIVQQMNDVAQSSDSAAMALLNVLNFGGIIAVNLAVMNLLPIPALDGGRAVGLLITTAVEKITRKKLNPKYEGYLHAAGMLLLLGLMAVIMFKDIIFIFKR